MFAALFAGFLGIAGGLALWSEYEKKHFVTQQYVIPTKKFPKGEVNVVFLSDLHNNEFGARNERLVREIERIRPDAVLIGGDMMVCKGERDMEPALCLVRRLARRFPVYYANGNHEERMNEERDIYGDQYEEFKTALEEAGVCYLSDASADFGETIRVTGANLDGEYYSRRVTIPALPEGTLKKRVGAAAADRFQILLFHSPLFFEECRKWGADLTLSGHFHGGTIRIPFLGGVMTPQYHFFLPWCAGRFDREGKTMIVSRGLGTHSINIRLNDRPHLVWVTIRGGGDGC